jgi:hypothetical protein
MKSGSVDGKDCNKCHIKRYNPGYMILRNQEKILNAITMAEIYNQGHETAKADRFINPNTIPMEMFSCNHLNLAAG